jgi:hypothetical protein
VSGTDNNGISIAPMTYQITIVGNFQPAPVTINGPSVLPSGTVGAYYANVFSVSGGSIPYTWSVRSGQLPPGLALNSDITLSQTGDDLSGTPATAGTFTFFDLKIPPEVFDEVDAEPARTLDDFHVPEREKAEVLAGFAARRAKLRPVPSQGPSTGAAGAEPGAIAAVDAIQ